MSGVTIGPLERCGVGIVGTDVAHDLAFEIVSRGEDAASDQVTLDLREPDFDLIEPGRVGRCVVDRDLWMLGQKRDDTLGLMSRKVVHDDMNFLVGRLGGHHVGQKGDKLRAGVTGGGLSNDLAGAHIQGGVERESAVTVVFEAVALGTAGRKRQDRVKPVQGLDGALFIDRENSRVHWWVEVETDDIGRLGLEVRIVAGHISSEAMGLKTGLAPDLRDVRLGRSQLSGQSAGAPLGGSPAGFAVQSKVDDPCFELLAARRGLTASMPAVESSQSILAETVPPQTHGIDTAALAGAGRPQRKPTTEIENDASPAAVFTASTATVGHLHKFPPFRRTNNKRCCHAFQHSFAVSVIKNSLH
jgi:hypothetical protein